MGKKLKGVLLSICFGSVLILVSCSTSKVIEKIDETQVETSETESIVLKEYVRETGKLRISVKQRGIVTEGGQLSYLFTFEVLDEKVSLIRYGVTIFELTPLDKENGSWYEYDYRFMNPGASDISIYKNYVNFSELSVVGRVYLAPFEYMDKGEFDCTIRIEVLIDGESFWFTFTGMELNII